ncbi:alanine/glycine:cation symporter family protein [Acidaminobacter hydrogenoformans]|uniref:Alanine or glycine:cation symporter, AGCS family n=1 Tax=Acidaminobacter hydrogenoformans DSM 2784 TaxID=1120920 RepID=A0A1G5RXY3_9FIRM|nr:alanine/glycine:cation symporter family protein [Acidaminobacter hydrogenoformans]SCZ78995.1 alanine or glycine:cation symporter, AGCS family [Acidaminobacter hydrogenoformans DSM 2784]
MASIIDMINGILWSNYLIYSLLIIGLYFTVRMKFIQFRSIKEMVKLLLDRKSGEQGITSFQAFALSIAGRVGVGNIAGVATAISLGGPGAVFWMWCLALIGSATAFVESTLAQVYKEEYNGQYRGGTAYYIEKYTGMKFLGILFAISLIYGSTVGVPWLQSHAIASSFENAFGISRMMTGIIVTLLVSIVIFGGVKRIGKVAEVLVPFMAGIYLLIALVIIVLNISELPGVIALIFKSAFGTEQAFAGIVGAAISNGVKRGIYSNEAGMGTATQAAAAADVSHPAKQGLVQAFSVYIDTMLVCTATAFMILITKSYNVMGPTGDFIVNHLQGVEAGPVYTQMAVDTIAPGFGSAFVAIALFLFAYTTLIAYYYAGETVGVYIQEKTGLKLIPVIRGLFVVFTLVGATQTSAIAWGMADIGVGLLTWINIIALAISGGVAIKVLKDYESQKAQGVDPIFNPDDLGIKNADVWRIGNVKSSKIEKSK